MSEGRSPCRISKYHRVGRCSSLWLRGLHALKRPPQNRPSKMLLRGCSLRAMRQPSGQQCFSGHAGLASEIRLTA